MGYDQKGQSRDLTTWTSLRRAVLVKARSIHEEVVEKQEYVFFFCPEGATIATPQ